MGTSDRPCGSRATWVSRPGARHRIPLAGNWSVLVILWLLSAARRRVAARSRARARAGHVLGRRPRGRGAVLRVPPHLLGSHHSACPAEGARRSHRRSRDVGAGSHGAVRRPRRAPRERRVHPARRSAHGLTVDAGPTLLERLSAETGGPSARVRERRARRSRHTGGRRPRRRTAHARCAPIGADRSDHLTARLLAPWTASEVDTGRTGTYYVLSHIHVDRAATASSRS